MTVSIDAAGRVVIPQAVRRRLGLGAGVELELDEVDGGVLLRPARAVDVDTGADGLPLLRARRGASDGEPMTVDDVQRLVDEDRGWPRR